ncbi:MAG: DUF6492 family protein [Pseudomonadota bacterium]
MSSSQIRLHASAIITPSYVGDFERCQLLCQSMDRFVTGHTAHYILVDNEDFELFKPLAGPNRHVVNEQDLLPSWLKVGRSGFGKSARKVWYSFKTLPMRGWHVQQLRRIAIAAHLDDEAMLYCDSDMMFVRPFDVASLWHGDLLRLYRIPGAITGDMKEHVQWSRLASKLVGAPVPSASHDDHINNLVSWRRGHVIAMCRQIERLSGRHWVSAIGRHRSFSECQIYGAFVANLPEAEFGHFGDDQALCQTYWSGEALTGHSLPAFVETMQPHQVAIGIQSFTDTDPALLRDHLDRAA